ncbi:mechanosensitive ion channel family protein [Natroniella acetigena]|uniref:mechanosensitive ion channel family protein n=1 Tax=Natroniella acetigena TaxID=52004 RepID=UPI00200AB5F5|nr:mechanosensitive ion channel family protein [Natroniella acetigena]MCK8827160.1 mechanosensitive ion channel family protein [Natroniella acetigena]
MESFDFSDPVVQKILFSVGAIVFNYFITFWVIRFINNKVDDFKRRHRSRRYTYYLATLINFVILVLIWADRTGTITTYLGFLSAGLALALHDVILNLAGWVLIMLRRPFGLGDRIEWDSVKGDVIDIRVFYTSLLEIGNWVDSDQSTGRIVHIPNSNIFREALFNYTRGFEYLWNELKFLVTYESDWEKAKEIILETAEQEGEEIQELAKRKIKLMSKRYMIKYSKFSPIVYLDTADSGVEITLRYLTTARGRRLVESRIREVILKKFAQESEIDFAYPTTRFYTTEE